MAGRVRLPMEAAMLRLLPMNEARPPCQSGGETVASLMGGVPSLAIGAVSLVLLASYLTQQPIGPPELYRVEEFPVYISPETGKPMGNLTVKLVFPSARLLGMLVAGVWCGVLGIIFGRRRGRHYRVTTSLAGTLTCAGAFLLAWIAAAWGASLW
jgi:hypothetical protein